MKKPSMDSVFNQLPSDGWLSYGEAELLYRRASLTKGRILEVGSYMGRSTCFLAQCFPQRVILAVDPWADGFHSELSGDAIYERFQANLQARNITNVRVFRQMIEDWIPQPCGLCYLDGDHTSKGTRAQIIRAGFCKPRVIAVHDVNDSGGGKAVKDACLECLGPWDERVERMAVWEVH